MNESVEYVIRVILRARDDLSHKLEHIRKEIQELSTEADGLDNAMEKVNDRITSMNQRARATAETLGRLKKATDDLGGSVRAFNELEKDLEKAERLSEKATDSQRDAMGRKVVVVQQLGDATEDFIKVEKELTVGEKLAAISARKSVEATKEKIVTSKEATAQAGKEVDALLAAYGKESAANAARAESFKELEKAAKAAKVELREARTEQAFSTQALSKGVAEKLDTGEIERLKRNQELSDAAAARAEAKSKQAVKAREEARSELERISKQLVTKRVREAGGVPAAEDPTVIETEKALANARREERKAKRALEDARKEASEIDLETAKPDALAALNAQQQQLEKDLRVSLIRVNNAFKAFAEAQDAANYAQREALVKHVLAMKKNAEAVEAEKKETEAIEDTTKAIEKKAEVAAAPAPRRPRFTEQQIIDRRRAVADAQEELARIEGAEKPRFEAREIGEGVRRFKLYDTELQKAVKNLASLSRAEDEASAANERRRKAAADAVELAQQQLDVVNKLIEADEKEAAATDETVKATVKKSRARKGAKEEAVATPDTAEVEKKVTAATEEVISKQRFLAREFGEGKNRFQLYDTQLEKVVKRLGSLARAEEEAASANEKHQKTLMQIAEATADQEGARQRFEENERRRQEDLDRRAGKATTPKKSRAADPVEIEKRERAEAEAKQRAEEAEARRLEAAEERRVKAEEAAMEASLSRRQVTIEEPDVQKDWDINEILAEEMGVEGDKSEDFDYEGVIHIEHDVVGHFDEQDAMLRRKPQRIKESTWDTPEQREDLKGMTREQVFEDSKNYLSKTLLDIFEQLPKAFQKGARFVVEEDLSKWGALGMFSPGRGGVAVDTKALKGDAPAIRETLTHELFHAKTAKALEGLPTKELEDFAKRVQRMQQAVRKHLEPTLKEFGGTSSELGVAFLEQELQWYRDKDPKSRTRRGKADVMAHEGGARLSSLMYEDPRRFEEMVGSEDAAWFEQVNLSGRVKGAAIKKQGETIVSKLDRIDELIVKRSNKATEVLQEIERLIASREGSSDADIDRVIVERTKAYDAIEEDIDSLERQYARLSEKTSRAGARAHPEPERTRQSFRKEESERLIADPEGFRKVMELSQAANAEDRRGLTDAIEHLEAFMRDKFGTTEVTRKQESDLYKEFGRLSDLLYDLEDRERGGGLGPGFDDVDVDREFDISGFKGKLREFAEKIKEQVDDGLISVRDANIVIDQRRREIEFFKEEDFGFGELDLEAELGIRKRISGPDESAAVRKSEEYERELRAAVAARKGLNELRTAVDKARDSLVSIVAAVEFAKIHGELPDYAKDPSRRPAPFKPAHEGGPAPFKRPSAEEDLTRKLESESAALRSMEALGKMVLAAVEQRERTVAGDEELEPGVRLQRKRDDSGDDEALRKRERQNKAESDLREKQKKLLAEINAAYADQRKVLNTLFQEYVAGKKKARELVTWLEEAEKATRQMARRAVGLGGLAPEASGRLTEQADRIARMREQVLARQERLETEKKPVAAAEEGVKGKTKEEVEDYKELWESGMRDRDIADRRRSYAEREREARRLREDRDSYEKWWEDALAKREVNEREAEAKRAKREEDAVKKSTADYEDWWEDAEQKRELLTREIARKREERDKRALNAAKEYDRITSAVPQDLVTLDDRDLAELTKLKRELDQVANSYETLSQEQLHFASLSRLTQRVIADHTAALNAERRALRDATTEQEKATARDQLAASARARYGDASGIREMGRRRADQITPADRVALQDLAKDLRAVANAHARGSNEQRHYNTMATEVEDTIKRVNTTINENERELRRQQSRLGGLAGVFDRMAKAVNRSGDSVAGLDNRFRGMLFLAVISFAQQFITALVGLAGALGAVASSAIYAAGAIGGALAAGLAQAIPVAGLLMATMSRVKSVMDIVKQSELVDQQKFQRANDSQKKLADTTDAVANAQDGLRSANDSLADAQGRVGEAQEGVTKARADAIRQLRDLILAEKDAELAARGAALNQEDAQQRILDAVASGEGDLDRLTLDYEQSGLDRQRADIGLSDTRQELTTRRQTGVEGSEGVVAAKKQVEDAREAVLDAERSVERARRGIDKARESASAAAADSFSGAEKLEYMLAQLTPAERAFYEAVKKLRDEYKEVFRPVTDILMRELTKGVNDATDLLGQPKIGKAAKDLAESIGEQMSKVREFLFDPEFVDQLLRIVKQAEKSLGPVTDIALNLVQAFTNIAEAAGPSLEELLGWFEDLSENILEITEDKHGLGKFFDDAADNAKAWGDAILAVIGLIAALAGVGQESGLGAVEDFTAKIQEWTEWIKDNRSAVDEFFRNGIKVAKELFTIVEALADMAIAVNDPEKIKPLVDIINNTLIPALEDAIKFLGWLTDKVLWVLNLPGVGEAVGLLIMMGLVYKVLRTMTTLLGTTMSNWKSMAGVVTGVFRALNKLTFGGLNKALGLVLLGVSKITGQLPGLGKVGDKLKEVADKLRGRTPPGGGPIPPGGVPPVPVPGTPGAPGGPTPPRGTPPIILGPDGRPLPPHQPYGPGPGGGAPLPPGGAPHGPAPPPGGPPPPPPPRPSIRQRITPVLRTGTKMIGKAGLVGAALSLGINLIDSKGNPIRAVQNTASDLTFGIIPRAKDKQGKDNDTLTYKIKEKIDYDITGTDVGKRIDVLQKDIDERAEAIRKRTPKSIVIGLGTVRPPEPGAIAKAFEASKGDREQIKKNGEELGRLYGEAYVKGTDKTKGVQDLFKVEDTKLLKEDFIKQLSGLPLEGRQAAYDSMVEMAKGFEKEGKLPKGATSRIVGGIRKELDLLPSNMRDSVGKGVNAMSKELRRKDLLDSADKFRQNLSETYRGFPKQAKTSGENAASNFTEQIEFLKDKSSKATGQTKKNIDADLHEVRKSAHKWAKMSKDDVVDNMELIRSKGGDKARLAKRAITRAMSQMSDGVGGSAENAAGALYTQLDNMKLNAEAILKALGIKMPDIALTEAKPFKKSTGNQGATALGVPDIGGFGAQRGALIPGKGDGDRHPILAESGEYVLNKKAVASIGSNVLDDINFRRFPRFAKGGQIVPIPGQPGESIHSSILQDVQKLIRRYKLKITDGLGGSPPHKKNSDHLWGGAIDAVPDPGKGGSWGIINQLARWAEPTQNAPRKPFRWVGYTGDTGHGEGDHIHLSWIRGANIGNVPSGGDDGGGGDVGPLKLLPQIHATGRDGIIKSATLGFARKARREINKFIKKKHAEQSADVSGSAETSGQDYDPGSGSNASNMALGKEMAAEKYGWTGAQWTALKTLWSHESGWNHKIPNHAGSGAYGIPQALPASKMANKAEGGGPDWRTNPATQISWGLHYIKSRYRNPVGAWNFWQHPVNSPPGASKNWYAQGGQIDGPDGIPVPIVAHAGEWVVNKAQQARAAALAGLSRDGLRSALGFHGSNESAAGGTEAKSNVLQIGDSLSVGMKKALEGFVKKLKSSVEEGIGSDEAYKRLAKNWRKAYTDVIFDVGTNDEHASTLTKNLKRAYKLLKGDQRLFIPTVKGGPEAKEKREAVKEFAATHSKAVVVDVAGVKGALDKLGHLTAKGYAERAKAFASAIKDKDSGATGTDAVGTGAYKADKGTDPFSTEAEQDRIKKLKEGIYRMTTLPLRSWEDVVREANRAMIALNNVGNGWKERIKEINKEISKIRGKLSDEDKEKIKELEKGKVSAKEAKKIADIKADITKEEEKEIKALQKQKAGLGTKKGKQGQEERGKLGAKRRIDVLAGITAEGGVLAQMEEMRAAEAQEAETERLIGLPEDVVKRDLGAVKRTQATIKSIGEKIRKLRKDGVSKKEKAKLRDLKRREKNEKEDLKDEQEIEKETLKTQAARLFEFVREGKRKLITSVVRRTPPAGRTLEQQQTIEARRAAQTNLRRIDEEQEVVRGGLSEAEKRLTALRKGGVSKKEAPEVMRLQQEIKKLQTAGEKLRQDQATGIQSLFEAQVAAQEADINAINKKSEKATDANERGRRIATVLGRSTTQFDQAQIGIANQHAKDLEDQIARAQSMGNTELADELTKQVNDLRDGVTELSVKILNDAIAQVEAEAAETARKLDLRGRRADLQARRGDREGAAAAQVGIQEGRTAGFRATRAGYAVQLAAATALGDEGAIKDLTAKIEDLDVTIEESEQTTQDLIIANHQLGLDIIKSRTQTTTGLIGSGQSMVEKLANIAGETAKVLPFLNKIGETLRGAGQDILEKIRGVINDPKNPFGAFAEKAEGFLAGASEAFSKGPEAFSTWLAENAGPISALVESMGGTDSPMGRALLDMIGGLADNTLAQLDNTQAIKDAEGGDDLQDWSSTAWKTVGRAIFDGMGGLVDPSYSIASAQTGAIVRKSGLINVHSAEVIVPPKGIWSGNGNTGNNYDVAVNIETPMQVADPVDLGNRIGYRLANNPNSR